MKSFAITTIIITLFTLQSTAQNCPKDMVRVTGEYCENLEEICLKWLDKPTCVEYDNNKCIKYNEPLRCQEFKNPTVCKNKRKHLDFCIDKYEYPNQFGVKPSLRNTWYEAKLKCETLNKRLCYEHEWTQACRGPNDQPYPYGYIRDPKICLIDLPWQDPTIHSFEELDKTVPSGTFNKCVSDYGVYDMTGNADEFTISNGNSPYKSILKGGHPHGVRNRCSPRTTGHNESFSFYDTGFRCCKDI